MKKLINIIVAVAVLALTVQVNAQNVINKSAIYDGEIVSISEQESGLFAYSSGLKIDNEGVVSGKVLSFYENGNLNETGTLIGGEKHGSWLRYSDNGALLNQANYNRGKKHGIWKVWDAEGNLRMKYEYDDGKRIGEWVSYDSEGNIESTKNY